MLSPISIQNALRIVVSLKEDGLEKNLKALNDEAVKIDGRQEEANQALKKADESLKRATSLDSKNSKAFELLSKRTEEVSALEAKSNQRHHDLSSAIAALKQKQATADIEIAEKQAELDKLLSAAKRAKTIAEKSEAKSAQILGELENKKARLEEAWS